MENKGWSVQKSSDLYGIEYWGEDIFRINEQGHVTVTPWGENNASLDLFELTTDLTERGVRVPVLLRFPDVTKARLNLINQCFDTAIQEYQYNGKYNCVYPVKVNQEYHLVSELVGTHESFQVGIECGSKPELLIGLALMSQSEGLIICNGFKDRQYIETALLSLKLGKNTVIVVDRFKELLMIIEIAKELKTRPIIGFRIKLNSKGSGRWVESSGAKSKFGLVPSEIVESVNILKEENMLDCLELVHFHIGSQIPSIQSVKASLKEAMRYFVELHQMGAKPHYIDVGGGLGVDYDGSGKTFHSTNYTEQEYANDVVSIVQNVCDEKDIPHPNIITESGRAIVAHGSVLIFNVLGFNELEKRDVPKKATESEHQILQDLQYMYNTLNEDNVNEYYNDLMEVKNEILQLFTYGVLSLQERAWADSFYWVLATRIRDIAKGVEDTEDIIFELNQELCSTYFCNFSVFQSLPDSWAVDHIFPVMPLQRLNEEPNYRAILVDLTCDSDGRIERFLDIDSGEHKKTLEVHKVLNDQPYYFGVFLTGAYQEILGDMHNLFGDTDAVHISLSEDGNYSVDSLVRGDRVKDVLSYVQYQSHELIEKIRQASEVSIRKGSLSKQEAKWLMKNYTDGLMGYTYLKDLGSENDDY